MSDKEQNQNNTASFYPPGIDNISQQHCDAVGTKADAVDVFMGELWTLNKRGPFLDGEGRIAVRAFGYKDVTLLAFLIEETDDSFLVLLPAHLSRDDKGVKATQVIATPMGRLMKTSVHMVSMPSPVQLLYYLTVMQEQFKTAEGYFNKERIGQIDSLVGILKENLGVKETTTKTKAKTATAEAKVELREGTFSIPDHMIPRIQH